MGPLITDPAPVALALSDPSLVGEARRLVVRLGQLAGLDADACSRVALVATELATNLLKHARRGELLARVFREGGRTGVEITSVDRGPGMRDVAECFRDGYSTAGSPGTGLGAVRRAADHCETYSLSGAGTVIVARVGAVGLGSGPLETGRVSACAPGETRCGDAVATETASANPVFMVVDGLGHGPHAAEAAEEATRVFRENHPEPLEEILRRMHGALLKTRGAAVTLARLLPAGSAVELCGVGNVLACVARYGGAKTVAPSPGIVGHQLPRLQTQRLPWARHDTLVMMSDGLQSPGRIFDSPGLLARHPAVIAGMLYGQLKRGRDDATALVARFREQP